MIEIIIYTLGVKTSELSKLVRFANLNNIRLKRLTAYTFSLTTTTLLENFKTVISSILFSGDLNFKFNVLSLRVNNNILDANTFKLFFLDSNNKLDSRIENINNYRKLVLTSYSSSASTSYLKNILVLINKKTTN